MKSFLHHLLVLTSLGLSGAIAETSPPPAPVPKQPPPACEAPEYRQFDFWLGLWSVALPDGKKAGASEITRAAGSCAILEQWKGAGGNPGTSINYYDTATRHWHQHWVGGDGSILALEGGLENGAMVLSGESKNPNQSKPTKNRITWTPMPEGKVKQEWATSDDGKTWKAIFVGIYSRP